MRGRVYKVKNFRTTHELIDIEIPKISSFVDSKFKDDSEKIKERIKENIAKFIQVFKIEERIHI